MGCLRIIAVAFLVSLVVEPAPGQGTFILLGTQGATLTDFSSAGISSNSLRWHGGWDFVAGGILETELGLTNSLSAGLNVTTLPLDSFSLSVSNFLWGRI